MGGLIVIIAIYVIGTGLSLALVLGTLFYLLAVRKQGPPQWPGWSAYGASLVNRFAAGTEEPDDFAGIFWWWELKRLPYNLLLAAVGLGASILFWSGMSLWPVPMGLGAGISLSEGIGTYAGLSLIYGIGANTFYTLGWLVETLVWKLDPKEPHRFGVLCYKAGVAFSILLTLAVPFLVFALLHFAWD